MPKPQDEGKKKICEKGMQKFLLLNIVIPMENFIPESCFHFTAHLSIQHSAHNGILLDVQHTHINLIAGKMSGEESARFTFTLARYRKGIFSLSWEEGKKLNIILSIAVRGCCFFSRALRNF